jgi:hypothetical protein
MGNNGRDVVLMLCRMLFATRREKGTRLESVLKLVVIDPLPTELGA